MNGFTRKRVCDVDDLKQRLVDICPKLPRILTTPQPDAVPNHRRRVGASDTPAQVRLVGAVWWSEIGRYEFWCVALAGADIRR